MELGERIATLREEKALTQVELAEKAGISPSTLSLIESGKVPRPHVGTIRKIARALGVEPKELRSTEELVLPKVERRSSREPSFDNAIEERRLSRFAEGITTAADAWINAATELDANRELFGLVNAAFKLYDSISEPLDSEQEWEKLTNPERQEVIDVLEKLNETATHILSRLEESGEAKDQEKKAKQNREKIREWTQQISA